MHPNENENEPQCEHCGTAGATHATVAQCIQACDARQQHFEDAARECQEQVSRLRRLRTALDTARRTVNTTRRLAGLPRGDGDVAWTPVLYAALCQAVRADYDRELGI